MSDLNKLVGKAWIDAKTEVALTYRKDLDAFTPTMSVDAKILKDLGFKDQNFKIYELDGLLFFLGSRSLTLCTIGGPDE